MSARGELQKLFKAYPGLQPALGLAIAAFERAYREESRDAHGRSRPSLEILERVSARLSAESLELKAAARAQAVAKRNTTSLDLVKAALRNPRAGFDGGGQVIEKRSDGINLGGTDAADAAKRREALDLMKSALSKPSLRLW